MRRFGVLQLGDRFDLRRCLGEGAMGVVYEALDRERNAAVALKTLTRVEPSAIYHLKNEFRTLAGLSHPNLVSLHELFAVGNTWFITMDLIAGTSFVEYARNAQNDALEATVTLDMRQAPVEPVPSRPGIRSPSPQIHGGDLRAESLREALGQLVEGVMAVHAAGKLHRDLKPSNVLVTSEGCVKILDFGLATDQASEGAQQSTLGSIEGTPAYMAPEQARGERAVPESDWYAVGVMVYEALTGRLPFWGMAHQVLWEKQQRLPVGPDKIAGGLPDDLVELCMELLRIEPAERPSGLTLLRRLKRDDGRPSHVQPTAAAVHNRSPGPSFVGRERHLRELAQALDDTEGDHPVVVRLHGLSGMGKSALLRQFGQRARHRQSAVVLEGRCYARESVPYKGVDGVVDALTRYLRRLPDVDVARLIPRHIHALSRVFPVLDRVEAIAEAPIRKSMPIDVHERRRLAISALAEMLSRINDEYPLVLTVDDFQWADADSVALLRQLLSLPEPPSCLLVLAYRSDETELSDGLRALDRALSRVPLDVRTIEVGALAAEEVRELGERLGSSGFDAEALWRESQGSPYFVHELVLQAALEPESVRSGRLGALSLDSALRRRIMGLDANARSLLELVCVSGRPVHADVLRMAAGLGDETDVLRTLSAENLVRVSGPPSPVVEIYHERVRDAVTVGLDPEGVRGLHERLGEVLEQQDGEPEPLAEHFLAAGHPQRAFHYAVLAVERAFDALAFERAARFCRVALELLPEEQRDQELVFQQTLGSALAVAGRSLEAARAYEFAAARVSGGEAARLQSLAAVQMLLGGRLKEGIAGVRASLAAYGLRVPDDPGEQELARAAAMERCRAQIEQRLNSPSWAEEQSLDIELRTRLDVVHTAPLGLYGLDLSPLGPMLATYDAAASVDAMEPSRCLRSLALMKSFLEAQGFAPPEEVTRFMRLAAEHVDDSTAHAWKEFNRGCTAYWEMDARVAVDALKRAEHLFSTECYGVMRLLGIVRLKLAMCQRLAGRVRELATDCDQWRRSAHERGDFFTELWMTILGPKALCAGDVETARQERQAALEHLEALDDAHDAPSIIDVARMAVLQQLAELDWYEGRPRQAWERLQPHFSRWQTSLGIAPVALHRMVTMSSKARALTALLSIEAREDLFREAVEVAEELKASDVPGLSGFGWAVSGSLALHGRNDPSEAEFHLRAARDRLASENPILFHSVGLRLGVLQGGEGGRRLEEEAEASLRAEGIADPRRWAQMEVPGKPLA